MLSSGAAKRLTSNLKPDWRGEEEGKGKNESATRSGVTANAEVKSEADEQQKLLITFDYLIC